MAFGGGGGGQLTPHVHNAVPLQGGPLDFTNNTIASLSLGSTTFSDGAALQELVIGNAGDSMVVNGAGTAPEWGSGGSGGGYSHVETFTATASSTFTCTLSSAIPTTDFIDLVLIWRGQWDSAPGSGGLELQIATDVSQPITANHYSWSGNVTGTSSTFHSGVDTDNFLIGAAVSDVGATRGNIIMNLTANPAITGAGGLNSEVFVSWWQTGINVMQQRSSGFTYEDSPITEIEGFHFTNSAGQNIVAGTTLDVFKLSS